MGVPAPSWERPGKEPLPVRLAEQRLDGTHLMLSFSHRGHICPNLSLVFHTPWAISPACGCTRQAEGLPAGKRLLPEQGLLQ